MCTVSFIKTGNNFVFTSNRDEHIARPKAHQPVVQEKNGISVLLPQDAHGGGTWFAMNNLGTICILLNGAYTNYRRKNGYKKSRGLIVMDIISNPNTMKFLKTIDLYNIAPFTLVLFYNMELFEFRWDGQKLYKKPMSEHHPNIWSSATLFSFEEQKHKRFLFKNSTQKDKLTCSEKLLALHKTPDKDGGFCIDRPSGHKTVSVSQAIFCTNRIQFLYHDVLQGKHQETRMNLKLPKTTIV